MPAKTVTIPEIGEVVIIKRRGSRSLRLSFTREGTPRVSIPYWVPFQQGIDFAISRREWLIKNQPARSVTMQHADRIGKAHRLRFVAKSSGETSRVKVSQGTITVSYPDSMDVADPAVQKAAERGALKALKSEADHLLPQRLRALAHKHGFSFKSVETKRLSSRWGSCSHARDITLNTYLMQLPWDLIDYVIIHELVHTEHLNHSAEFWQRFEQIMPNARARRKLLKTYKTAVIPVQNPLN